jgi:hypothetical protein
VAGLGINRVEPPGSTTRELLMRKEIKVIVTVCSSRTEILHCVKLDRATFLRHTVLN